MKSLQFLERRFAALVAAAVMTAAAPLAPAADYPERPIRPDGGVRRGRRDRFPGAHRHDDVGPGGLPRPADLHRQQTGRGRAERVERLRGPGQAGRLRAGRVQRAALHRPVHRLPRQGQVRHRQPGADRQLGRGPRGAHRAEGQPVRQRRRRRGVREGQPGQAHRQRARENSSATTSPSCNSPGPPVSKSPTCRIRRAARER